MRWERRVKLVNYEKLERYVIPIQSVVNYLIHNVEIYWFFELTQAILDF